MEFLVVSGIHLRRIIFVNTAYNLSNGRRCYGFTSPFLATSPRSSRCRPATRGPEGGPCEASSWGSSPPATSGSSGRRWWRWSPCPWRCRGRTCRSPTATRSSRGRWWPWTCADAPPPCRAYKQRRGSAKRPTCLDSRFWDSIMLQRLRLRGSKAKLWGWTSAVSHECVTLLSFSFVLSILGTFEINNLARS